MEKVDLQTKEREKRFKFSIKFIQITYLYIYMENSISTIIIHMCIAEKLTID